MGVSRKSLAVLLIVTLFASSLLLIESSSAQSTIKPDVPQFRIVLVKHSYDSAPVTSTDPFTGSTTIEPSVHYDWLTVDLVITNQNLPEQEQSEGYSYKGLMFNVRYKGHFSGDWQNISWPNGQLEYYSGPYMPHKSGYKYTIFSLKLQGNMDFNTIESASNGALPSNDIPQGTIGLSINGTADFQVEALYGTSYKYMGVPLGEWVFSGQESGWSSTQSITINEADAVSGPIDNPTVAITTPTSTASSITTNIPTTTSSANASDTKMDLITLPLTVVAALIVALAITALSLVLLYRKTLKNR